MPHLGKKQTVYLSEGSLAQLPQIFQQYRAVRTFLVVDEVAYNLSGAAAQLRQFLPPDAVTLFSGFEPNPKIEDVERGVAKCRTAAPEMVLALGGGTAIDLAKMIAAMSLQDESPRDIAINGLALSQGTLPLVVIPTTAGTGSESTHFAVVYADGQKYSVADSCLLPCVAVVDPELTYSLPPQLTATTGLDAFCQAIESIWAVGATDESVAYAKTAATLALEHLPTAVNTPNSEARHAMSLASHLAGKAINISKTTLPHAISYALTSDYGIPHGAAVAITLSSVLAYNFGISNSDCADQRGTTHVRQRLSLILDILDVSTVEDACQRIEGFITSLGCNPTPATAGISSDESLRMLASRVNAARLANNPRIANLNELFLLLKSRNAEPLKGRQQPIPPKATAG